MEQSENRQQNRTGQKTNSKDRKTQEIHPMKKKLLVAFMVMFITVVLQLPIILLTLFDISF